MEFFLGAKRTRKKTANPLPPLTGAVFIYVFIRSELKFFRTPYLADRYTDTRNFVPV
jgi:hypothetical protein